MEHTTGKLSIVATPTTGRPQSGDILVAALAGANSCELFKARSISGAGFSMYGFDLTHDNVHVLIHSYVARVE